MSMSQVTLTRSEVETRRAYRLSGARTVRVFPQYDLTNCLHRIHGCCSIPVCHAPQTGRPRPIRPLPFSWRNRQRAGRRPLRVLVREATPEDVADIRNVLRASVTTLIERPYTRPQIAAWIADEDPGKFTRDSVPGRQVFVAESQGRVVGFSRLAGTEVEALYVHPAQAGCKVGELLLSVVEATASLHDVTTLYLDAALNAVSFYESGGYRVLGPSLALFDDGVALPCVRMQKTLCCRCLDNSYAASEHHRVCYESGRSGRS